MPIKHDRAGALAYLFVVDLVRQIHHDFTTYHQTEPGYAQSWLEAYIEAFDYSNDGVVTEDLLKLINRTAMSWQGVQTGQFKQSHNNITMYFGERLYQGRNVYNSSFSVSLEGLQECVKYWMQQQETDIYMMGLIDENSATPNAYIINGYDRELEAFNFVTNIGGKRNFYKYSLDEITAVIKPLIEAGRISFVSNDIFEQFPSEQIEDLTEQHVRRLISEYHTAINHAETDFDKITAIAQFIQRLDQLHPFPDGNIRTCYILMNKLLRDNGLDLALVVNLNRLDGCSLLEVVAMIADGQLLYQSLMGQLNNDTNVVKLESHVCPSCINPIQCSDQKMTGISERLISQFYEVMNVSLVLSEPRIGLFEHSGLTMPANIREPLSNGQYGLALRRSCAKASTIEEIQEVLNQAGDNVDITEKSSNGRTAVDWLKFNVSLTLKDKRIVTQQLLDLTCNTAINESLI